MQASSFKETVWWVCILLFNEKSFFRNKQYALYTVELLSHLPRTQNSTATVWHSARWIELDRDANLQYFLVEKKNKNPGLSACLPFRKETMNRCNVLCSEVTMCHCDKPIDRTTPQSKRSHSSGYSGLQSCDSVQNPNNNNVLPALKYWGVLNGHFQNPSRFSQPI